jgi:large subunit ribosomal protein L6
MSRVANKPISIPSNVTVTINGQIFRAKGPKGEAEYLVPDLFFLDYDKNVVVIRRNESRGYLKPNASLDILAGTTRANLNNVVVGVSQGYEKRLNLVGVGFRGQVQGQALNLSLGFSHPTVFNIPFGIHIEMPSPTEIVVMGVDKQLVSQVAAKVRAMRTVEPYKGKGIRYKDERVILKETKKK